MGENNYKIIEFFVSSEEKQCKEFVDKDREEWRKLGMLSVPKIYYWCCKDQGKEGINRNEFKNKV